MRWLGTGNGAKVESPCSCRTDDSSRRETTGRRRFAQTAFCCGAGTRTRLQWGVSSTRYRQRADAVLQHALRSAHDFNNPERSFVRFGFRLPFFADSRCLTELVPFEYLSQQLEAIHAPRPTSGARAAPSAAWTIARQKAARETFSSSAANYPNRNVFWAPNWQIFDSSSLNEAPLDGLTSLHRGIMRNATKNPQVGNGTVCGGLVKIYLSK